MRDKIFICGLIFLLLFPAAYGNQENTGKDEELNELVLTHFPPSSRIQAEQPAAANIKALMIGMTKFDPPSRPEWNIYYFYDSYWSGSPDRWIGFVVANYSNEDVNITAQIEVCYNDGKTLWTKKWKKKIQKNQAVLYFVKTTIPKKVGLYSLKGKVYGAEGLGHNNEVSTNYYIHSTS